MGLVLSLLLFKNDETKQITTVPEISQPNLDPHPNSSSGPFNASETENQKINPKISTERKNSAKSEIMSNWQNYPEQRYYLMSSVNDPLRPFSWALDKIQAEYSWDIASGEGITIAVIDSGFALDHEDLISKWGINDGESGLTIIGDPCWVGVAEDKKFNLCDDDQNGFVDDWRGYDFYHLDNDVQAGTTNPYGDAVNHGSMVAGTASASGNNNSGSSGIGFSSKIMPLQVFNDDGYAYTSDIVSAIEYAVDNGARVINLSLGANAYDAPMHSAVQYANNNGVLVVAASGNCALNNFSFCNSLQAPGRMTYPALHEEVLSVGSTNSSDQRSDFSSYGSQLDLTAPGQNVGPLPTYSASNPISSYAYANGTSFSSPMVAGIAAQILSEDNTQTITQLKERLIGSADKVSGTDQNGFSSEYGFGRANAHKSTLLSRAFRLTSDLASTNISPRQPNTGQLFRVVSGNIDNNEWILVACRSFISDTCRITLQRSGQISQFLPIRPSKGQQVQMALIKGSSVGTGTSDINLHSQEYTTHLTTINK